MDKPKLKFQSSWDDGRAEDVKLFAMLVSHVLPATFYIPDNSELSDEEIQHFAKVFEIGGHTVNHPMDMKQLSEEQIRYEVGANKQWLENLIGKEITKFCYPRGRYDQRVIEEVKKAGYESARTTVVLKTEVVDPYQSPTTIHVYQRSEYLETDWVEVAKKYAEYASLTDTIFHIWGHSWEIEKFNYWDKLDELFKYLRENYEIISV